MAVACMALLHGLALWGVQRGLRQPWLKPAEALLPMNVKLIVPPAPPAASPPLAQPAPAAPEPPIRKPAKPPKPVAQRVPQSVPQAAQQAEPQPAPEAPSAPMEEPAAATAAQSSAPPAPTVAAAPAAAAPSSSEAQCPGNSPPPYPAISTRLGETGRVIVQGLIGADGRVRETRLQNSSGYARLDNAALQAVRHWRCQPVMRDGVPQEAWRNAPVDFILK